MKKKPIILLILCILVSSLLSGATFSEAELKGMLLSNNLRLKAAKDEHAIALLDRKDAKAGYGPTIELEMSGTYLQNRTLITIPANPPIFNPPNFPMKIEMEPTLYNFSLTLTQPVWTWGKLRNGVAMTEKLVEIRQKQRFALEKALLAELESRLYAHYYLGVMESFLKEQTIHAEALVSLVQNSFSSGMALEEDVLASQVSAKEIALAKVQVSQQKQRQLSAIGRLCNTTFRDDDHLTWAPDKELFTSMLGYDLKTLQAMATGKNQEQVRIATLMSELAELSTSIAKGDLNWKPDVAMQASLGYGGSKFPFIEDGWKDKDDYTLNVSVGVKTTIWDGGKRYREVSRSAIKEGQTLLDMGEVYQAIRAQVEEAYFTLRLAYENVEYLQLKERSATAERAQQELLFASGYGSEIDLLKAKLALLAIGFEMEQQWLSYSGAFATLNALCGVENPL